MKDNNLEWIQHFLLMINRFDFDEKIMTGTQTNRGFKKFNLIFSVLN